MTSVFILVDALGWELVRDRPFLTDVLPYRRSLRTVLGFSSGAIPSILTGLLPEAHGHWNLFLYRPESSPFRWLRPLRHLPSRWINHRAVRKAVSLAGRKLSGSDGYFSIYGIPLQLLPYFDICEKHDIYRPGGLRPRPSIFDRLEQAGVPYRVYSYHRYSDREAVRASVRDLRAGAARFYFVYLAELDAFLHRQVNSPEALEPRLAQYAEDIRRIFEAAVQRDPETAFYVFSDHGMTPIRETFDLISLIRGLGWKEPRDYLALYDSTMARFWFFSPQARRAIQIRLESLECGRVLSPQDQKALGIGFSDARFGELIFLMRPGCLICPSYMGRTPWAGMHGFDPDDPHSSAALLARRPPPVAVEGIWQMFDLMRHEAGL